MPFACIHTHTLFCDGFDNVETLCQKAYEKGLHSLGFSAHAPITGKTAIKSTWNMADDKLDEYIDTVRRAQKQWEGRLPVYLGLELDYIHGLMGPADVDYREMGLDYIIGVVHYVIPPKGSPFTVDDRPENVEMGIREGYGGDPMGMVENYWTSLEAMIRAGGFDLLGHPDLIKKNNDGNRFFSEDDEFYRRKTASIADLMSGTGLPAEVNTGGINRGKIKDCYPSLGFMKLFRDRKVPMVVNADAHRADDLDGNYDAAHKTLLEAGYREMSLFEGRKDGKARWKSVEL